MSFSQETKNYLSGVNCKKKCCKHSMMYGLLLFAHTFSKDKIRLVTENDRLSELFPGLMRSLFGVTCQVETSNRKSGDVKTVNEELKNHKIVCQSQEAWKMYGGGDEDKIGSIRKEIFQCPNCEAAFLRGAFLSGGTISDPMSGYHLEISTPSNSLANSISDLMNENGLMSKVSVRKTRSTAYFKDSVAIEDFLTYIGAQNAALNMMNTKIMRDIRNNENRRSNCDAANIYKITGSAKEQTDAIEALKNSGKFDELSSDLKATAELRLQYPFESLIKLAEMHNPPITKSGVNHRLKKLIELSKQ